MANSDWVHADQIDKLKPVAERFYKFCVDYLNSQTYLVEPFMTSVEWCHQTNRVMVYFVHSAVSTHRFGFGPLQFSAATPRELALRLMCRGFEVPPALSAIVAEEIIRLDPMEDTFV